MAGQQEKRSLWDDLMEGAREVVEALGRIFNPERRPQRVPIPIPVSRDPRYPQRRDER
ncbi:MAG: hypothetical protein MUF38_04550 [Anaerolineae bacterium]|jgi:hypothetical protein|nr:hypothetical protein [Anaerolineae bacterium]